MCGIAGLRNEDSRRAAAVSRATVGGLPNSATESSTARNAAAAASLEKMLDLLRHRGPDDRGTWSSDDWLLGMTRLAIIDPEHGRQPMQSRDGRWILALNGEIYNFLDLRGRLKDRGIVFRTQSDTEVLLELIACDGVVAALGQIEGMFAFAAVDIASGDLWLARDRFGEKPLYIDRRDGGFGFCSELAPLLEARDCSRKISASGLLAILRYGSPWMGKTAIEGISELPPAHWLRRSPNGGEASEEYWQPPDRIDEQAGSLESCAKRVLELLHRSVRSRLIADVPLGLFLSGGIDSGAVAEAAVEQRPDLHAVTVGFEHSKYDERPLARLTAQRLQLRLEEEQGSTGRFTPEVFDELLRHYGQPFADTSSVPTRVVSQAARRHFKVVLSGDGGDELFSGYMAHARSRLLASYGGGAVGGAFSAFAAAMLPESGRLEGVHRALTLNASRVRALLPVALAGVFSDASALELVEGTPWHPAARQLFAETEQECRELVRRVKDANLALSLYQLRHSLPQDILAKVDRMSMAESLEVRAPFLDSTLASYALSLPPHLKMKGSLGKVVLREALRNRLPQPVLRAKKRGFAMPVDRWLGETFWKELRSEVDLYKADSSAELNIAALEARVQHDSELCRKRYTYRALHRSVLLYGFLRWRRTLVVT